DREGFVFLEIRGYPFELDSAGGEFARCAGAQDFNAHAVVRQVVQIELVVTPGSVGVVTVDRGVEQSLGEWEAKARTMAKPQDRRRAAVTSRVDDRLSFIGVAVGQADLGMLRDGRETSG